MPFPLRQQPNDSPRLFLVEKCNHAIQLSVLHGLRAPRMLLAHLALASMDGQLGHTSFGSCLDPRVKWPSSSY